METISGSNSGDALVAQKRVDFMKGIPVLQTSTKAMEIASHLTEAGLIPQGSAADALHVAIATAQGIEFLEFLLTWNCRHIANAEIAERLEALLGQLGYQMPTLCTPEQLMGS